MRVSSTLVFLRKRQTLRLLNALNSEDRGLKVRFSHATIAFDRESAQMSQILSSQGKNAPSKPYPHYLVRLATSRKDKKIKRSRSQQRSVMAHPPLSDCTEKHRKPSVLGSFRARDELSGPLRLRVQSRSRTRLRIAASIAFLFRACFKGGFRYYSATIARLSPLSGLE